MRLVALALNLLMLCVCLQASAQEQEPITVTGKLVNITLGSVTCDNAESVNHQSV
jgi:hypothetical protein